MIFLDTETTGLPNPIATNLTMQPYIIEITAIKTDYDMTKVIQRIDTTIRPPIKIPENITRITGIDDDMVSESPRFVEILDDLINMFLGEKTMVAHNANFDKTMLFLEMERLDREKHFPWTPNDICTVEKSMSICGHRMKLGQLHEHYFNVPITGAHRSENDVYAMMRIFERMREENLV